MSAPPRPLRPFYADDGSLNGRRVFALAAAVLSLVVIAGSTGSVVLRSGNANAGGYAILVILLGLKLPALAILFGLLMRHLRAAMPGTEDIEALEALETRLAEVRESGSAASAALEADAWDLAHRASGTAGTRAAAVALASRAVEGAGRSRSSGDPVHRPGAAP